ncbi:3'-5' exonuclease [Thalassolituus maritimus]|uniref:Exonuclease domain-containing protein n=1 Tax=Thalassolituus maritimus TaxID=484498 RepID=A0ABP9ZXZ4_9GAMM
MSTSLPPIIDVEASGFGRGSFPIEIGFALEDRKVQSYLIRPSDNWTHWSDEAEAIHGISRQQLEEDGLGIRDVALLLNEHLFNKTLYSDAWSFDSSWIGRLFEEAELVQRFRIETINKLLTMEEMERWADTKSTLWNELDVDRHRAANDVKVLQETFKRVISAS